MDRRIAGILLVLCAVETTASAQSSVAVVTTQPSQNQDGVALDEVVVRGQRLALLREEIVEAEDRFYARYNELNSNDEFDIVCQRRQRTGTIMVTRVCFPRIVEIATGTEAAAIAEAYDRNKYNGEGEDKAARPQGTPASVVLAAKSPEYKAGMLRLLRKHPELRALVAEQEELQRRYDRARKKQSRGAM